MAIDKALPNVKQEVKIPGVDEQLKTEVIQKLHQQKMVVLKLILNQVHLIKNKVKAILII